LLHKGTVLKGISRERYYLQANFGNFLNTHIS
jgi:hypothetical protein